MRHSPNFLRQVESSISALVRINSVCAVLTGLVVPTLVAVLCTFDKEVIAFSAVLFWGVLTALIVAAAAYSLWSLKIVSAPEALIEIDDLRRKSEGLEEAVERLSTTDYLCTVWRGSIDGFTTRSSITKDQVIGEVGVLCGLVVEHRGWLYRFERSELWNFAVYLYDETQDRLFCVWHERCPGHPASGTGRAWKPGQGHVGLTFSNRSQHITADTRNPEVARLMRAPGDTYRKYDDEAYRALQTEPITTSDERVIGVVVATSDRPGRFDEANSLTLVHLAGELASLLSVAWTGTMSELTRP